MKLPALLIIQSDGMPSVKAKPIISYIGGYKYYAYIHECFRRKSISQNRKISICIRAYPMRQDRNQQQEISAVILAIESFK